MYVELRMGWANALTDLLSSENTYSHRTPAAMWVSPTVLRVADMTNYKISALTLCGTVIVRRQRCGSASPKELGRTLVGRQELCALAHSRMP